VVAQQCDDILEGRFPPDGDDLSGHHVGHGDCRHLISHPLVRRRCEQCPASVPVDVTWRGTGQLERINEHTIRREPARLENTWTRGWRREATISGTVGNTNLGTPLGADLTRADQGEIIVQHQLD